MIYFLVKVRSVSPKDTVRIKLQVQEIQCNYKDPKKAERLLLLNQVTLIAQCRTQSQGVTQKRTTLSFVVSL